MYLGMAMRQGHSEADPTWVPRQCFEMGSWQCASPERSAMRQESSGYGLEVTFAGT